MCFYCLVFKDFITKMKLNQVNPQNVNANKQLTTQLHIRKQEKQTLLEDLMLMMLLPS